MAGTAGRSGRRPKPTARKALAGNPGKRALNKDEPVFTPIKGVEPPEWFAEEDLPLATIMWQLTTKELCGQGLLCVTDLAVLERWCVAYEFWRRAVKNIARQGNTITGAMGGMVKNPELTAKKEQESEMSSTGAMLGLDPSSRQRLIGLAGQKKTTNPNAANQYARDVVRGKIVACQFVIQACQRHLDDLMAEKSKSFRYRFDKDLAERAAKFIQLLPHTKGEWAFKRMPITLEPWQLFVICCAFGWVNKGSRLRRFREVYTEIPRKNGKSAISAGVALYCFACDNEFGAEVYSGATTEKQAWEVFRPARLMCKRTPMLTEACGIEVNASNMNRPEDGARFEPLIGNPGDGSSPHCAVVDEYHEHATDALYTTMLTGMGARRQPLMWAITTAGYNIEGPCYDKRREVIEMLNGSVPNDELFGIIYTVDEGDDWTDPQVLEKANPNIGVSVIANFC